MKKQNLVQAPLKTLAIAITLIAVSCEKETIETIDNSLTNDKQTSTAAKFNNEPTVSLRNHANWQVVSHNNFEVYREGSLSSSGDRGSSPKTVTADRANVGYWETLKIVKLDNGKFAISGVNTSGQKAYLGFPNDKSRFSQLFVKTHFYLDNPWDGAEQFDMINVGSQGLDSNFIEVMFKCINGQFLTIRGNDGKTCSCSGQDDPNAVWDGDKKSIFRLQLQNTDDKLSNYFTL